MVQGCDPLLWLPNTFRPFYGAFSHLHPIQVQAIRPVLEGRDLIVQASTGSGKSEAVLAPCLERVIASGRAHGVLYIIPTRALAKDLTRRFELIITERLGLNLAIRTGDLKQNGKKRPDIMFTTPESLDVMLGSANADLKAFLFRVRIVVIDEVHPLIHQYRGRHLVYLLARLERRTGEPLQKIAMSATIARIRGVMDFLHFRPDAKAIAARAHRRIVARLVHLKNEAFEIIALLNDLYRAWHYRKILVFCNSRSACDRLSGIVRSRGIFRDVTELHYSNLKPLERKKAEDRFRKRPHALCIATSTLELGIDVGDVDAVLLYQPPGSVSSFLQRIGRSNRRGDAINFWGICSGETAGMQVVRFLALLDLARRGRIEDAFPKKLPSVLSQQVISCLYEKKEISLNALQDLFPDQRSMLPSLFSSLEKKGWLKKTRRPGLIRGGWQYRNHFLDHKIWGNFPEAEKEYLLEVAETSVADIPQSIVSQMDVGDRVYLSGRHLKILKIDPGDPGKVVARPSRQKDEKELVWVGLGAHVSREVARAMGRMLRAGTAPEDGGLLNRTKTLLQDELALNARRVILANGIEVVPGREARFHFRTFLGSAGNLVLEWVIRDYFQTDDLDVTSHEIGVECSRWIDVEKLALPVEKVRFHAWVASHFKVLRSLIPLNIFWKTLPRELMVEEVSDFLFDPRVAETFAHYLESSSDIVSGDMADLAGPDLPVEQPRESLLPEMNAGVSLLDREKQKVSEKEPAREMVPTAIPFGAFPWNRACLAPDHAMTLTATMISDYFFHGQCPRRFRLKYLGLDRPVQEEDDLQRLVREQGIHYEQAVLAALVKQGKKLVNLESTTHETSRWAASIRQLKEMVGHLSSAVDQARDGHAPEVESIWCSQCYLKTDHPGPDFPHIRESIRIRGIGVPDLLVLSPAPVEGDAETGADLPRVVIAVGDIKSSRVPGYHHKWQVAFYALLLETILSCHHIPARVSRQGFIFTPSMPSARGSARESAPYQSHAFDLTPYLAAFPMLFHGLAGFLYDPPAIADHRLQAHCISCSGFPACYHEALANEDVQFLPVLTRGELVTLRLMGCTTLARTHRMLKEISDRSGEISPETESRFSPEQRLSPGQIKKLMGWCNTFLTHRISLHEKKTHLFPENLSRIFFIHIEKEPMTGEPRVLGWQVRDTQKTDAQKAVESQVWTMNNRQERQAVWKTFTERMSRLWEQSIHSGLGPHIFHFGSETRNTLLQWDRDEPGDPCPFFRRTQPSPWTDLKTVLAAHFYMPAPGVLSLYTLGTIFKCPDEVPTPPTLFHYHNGHERDVAAASFRVAKDLSVMAELYEKALSLLESRWVREWPASDRRDKRVLPYITFIEEEKRLKEADIQMLQEQPLKERMLRFRSMGYLTFNHTRLDHGGRFLYIFSPSPETRPAKFRQGDFLKLVPHGMTDLQAGFPVIMAEYDTATREIGLLSRSGRLRIHKGLFYSLEEEMGDWNREKLLHAADTLFSSNRYFHVQQMLTGNALERRSPVSLDWVKTWLARDNRGLNPSQQQALMLPFQYRTSMIQGPPGTGKTHLLGWIIIALMLEAHDAGKPLRIGVSALTHQAIDTVLEKVVQLVNRYLPGRFPGQCVKWGENRFSHTKTVDHEDGRKGENSGDRSAMAVEYLKDAHDLPARPWLILGATGYGFYSLFNSKDKGFPLALDWVIFDEASQVPVPQALLSLMYGRENFLFLGDVNQLPPIVMGHYEALADGDRLETVGTEADVRLRLDDAILSNIRNQYPVFHQVTLNITYRMNREICAFPSETWYDGDLSPAPGVDRARLCLPPLDGEYEPVDDNDLMYNDILDPEKPVVLVLTDHQGCSQQSDVEAHLMAALTHRLIRGHGLSADQMAIITPHRAQNNAIVERLGKMMTDTDLPGKSIQLPLVDTVERTQGAERDVILFGLTASDPDHLLSEFLNSPNRLNVAMTRARTKLIIVGSTAFFSIIPSSESLLDRNSCFKRLLTHCRANNAVFHFSLDR